MRRVVLIVGLVACGTSSERAKDAAPAPPPPKATVPDAGAPAPDAAAEKKVEKKDPREIFGGDGPVPAVTGQVLRGGTMVDVATLELGAGGIRCSERGGDIWLKVYAGRGELLSIGFDPEHVKLGKPIKVSERDGPVDAILWPMNQNPRKGTVTLHTETDAEFDLDFGDSGTLAGRVKATKLGSDRCIID